MNNYQPNSKSTYIKHFRDISKDLMSQVGGKGANLSYLYQRGFPVPEGFIVFSNAFENDELKPTAWNKIQEKLTSFMNKNKDKKFAVRSSALVEDSSEASFGGQFDTFLNIRSMSAIKQAIKDVYNSRKNERVKTYSQAKGITVENEMAIVLQVMIPSEISGVIFTADPITGNDLIIKGNYIYGLGDKLVSGEVDAFEFTIEKNSSEYQGSIELKKYRRKILKLIKRIEREFRSPLDIEWCIYNNTVYILQSRPITNLITLNLINGETNDSLIGNYLWSNSNAAEAVPDVMTPFTWSFWKMFHFETSPLKTMRNYPFAGNICGRAYFNFSLLFSFYKMISRNPDRAIQGTEALLGRIPKEMSRNLMIIPFSKKLLIKVVLGSIPAQRKYKKLQKQLPAYTKEAPEICRSMEKEFLQKNTLRELDNIWNIKLKPYLLLSLFMIRAGMNLFSDPYSKLKNELTKLIGEQGATELLSNLSGNNDYLESMGPVIGLFKIQRGKIRREEYLQQYGHRGPHECELSLPRPSENPKWIDDQLKEYSSSNLDVDAMIKAHRGRFEESWKNFVSRYPKKSKKITKKLEQVRIGAYKREASRSETIRVVGLLRSFLLHIGSLTGITNDIFFLTLEELEKLLREDDRSFFSYIPARKETYERYLSFPPYPVFIKGSFNPKQWFENPTRRSDFYDATATEDISQIIDYTRIEGFPGAVGRVEGVVRVIFTPEEGDELIEGEILVTPLTNVGWTPLFPRAKAIITDTGAPLSHAAIVARELGIPAVVGTGDATMRLKTGDRVIVDGGAGIVTIVSES